MYKVLKGNQEIALLKNPTWIKVQENGYYGLCEKEEAHGVVIKKEKIVEGNLVVEDKVYHVEGLPEIENVETVMMLEVDEGMYLFDTINKQKQFEADIEYLAIMSGVDLNV